MFSLLDPLLAKFFDFAKRRCYTTNETFRFFIDLFAILSSIVVGEFCSVIFALFYGALNYLDVFLVQVYAIKCVY